MSHRYPRNHFTKILHRIFSRLDKYPIAEVEWFEYIIRRERQSSSIEVKKIWVFGSYARGALNCGDLDLIVEIAGDRQPPRSSVFRVFFSSAPDVHIYLGTPQKNGSGLEVTDSILIWDGKTLDWMSAIAGIRDNPEATHFSRAIDRLPFRAEQLQAYSDTLEEIVEAEKQGIIKWAISALPEPIPENRLDEFGEIFARQFHDAGKKTRQIGHHIFAYMQSRQNWFGSHPSRERNSIDWGGCRILMGNPYVPIHWLDQLDVFELVIAPHISRRGPNGIWSIARGDNHPLKQRLKDIEFFVYGLDTEPDYLIRIYDPDSWRQAYLVELYSTETSAANAARAWDGNQSTHIQSISGDNLLALLATADIVAIDNEEFAKSHIGKIMSDFDVITPTNELLDILTSKAGRR